MTHKATDDCCPQAPLGGDASTFTPSQDLKDAKAALHEHHALVEDGLRAQRLAAYARVYAAAFDSGPIGQPFSSRQFEAAGAVRDFAAVVREVEGAECERAHVADFVERTPPGTYTRAEWECALCGKRGNIPIQGPFTEGIRDAVTLSAIQHHRDLCEKAKAAPDEPTCLGAVRMLTETVP